MHTIRGKLFVSIGTILVIIALLSYAVPNFFIVRDIDSASSSLSEKFTESAKKIQLAFASLVSSQFIEQYTQLEGLSQLLAQQDSFVNKSKSLRELAGEMIGYAPNLSYVQISDQKKTVVVAPENGTLYIPEWAELGKENLAIRLPDGRIYEAKVPTYDFQPDQAYFFLYPLTDPSLVQNLTFQSFELSQPIFKAEESPYQLYEYMRWNNNQVNQRAEMIQLLSENPQASGMLTADSTFNKGYALLAEEVFLSQPEVEEIPLPTIPYLLLRKLNSTFYLDFIHYLFVSDLEIVLGYSLSKIANQVATILQKPLLLSAKQSEGIVFFPDNKQAILPEGSFDLHTPTLTLRGKFYYIEPHRLGELTVSVLIPYEEATSIEKLMKQLREGLVDKISLNLLLVTICVLILGLFLLARISKRMTRPIAKLARASEEIGKGNYEKLSLPKVEKRKDEIATLTHAFEGMVIALREREKIRSTLNKVVSKEVAAEILKSDVELGGEDRVVTLLLSDIRNFTTLSNLFAPKEMIQMLNQYMTHMCHLIDETHGVVDKFVGDEIMALYGAPLFMEDHADKALEAAFLMIQDLNQWNEKQIQQGKRPLEIGIGVHTGSVCAGNMGAENRLNYTVIGANVNLVARMCAVANPMQILVTKETIHALQNPERFTFNQVAPMRLKGFEKPQQLFELIKDERSELK